ncbi:MAG: MBL fold metallo-hydrolase [Bacteroidia bacterium]|nr:MBL fold metallo-hydrolase [Bacteroidia bacterium]
MLQVKSFVFNDFQENTYIVWDQTKACAIIDPGSSNNSERNLLRSFIEENQLKPSLLLNTHCHIDHILGNLFVSEHYKLPLHMSEGELFTYKDTDRWAAMFGLPKFDIPENLVFIQAGETLTLGSSRLDILSTPGHSIASLSFYAASDNLVFCGDVIFKQSIGRTDLPGGNFEVLAKSIREQIYTLPEETLLYSGHGPVTRVGSEKNNNPFVKL